MKKVKEILELIKEYQRPVRCLIWIFLTIFAFIYCLTSQAPCNEGFVIETILLGMFADMGVYSVLRTVEKRDSIKVKTEKNEL